MALFKNKKGSDLQAPPAPDFDISKPDFEDDFPKYTPTIGSFNDVEKRKPFISQMPKKMAMEDSMEKKTGPVFIKIDKYDEAVDHINSIKDKVNEIENVIENLKKIKREEDNALDEWKSSLNEIKEKLMMIDRSLFES